MRKIVHIKFGSHLYGTSTPLSDVDLKSVYIPDRRDILLQRVKGSVSTKRAKAEGEKNFAGEIDEESYSLLRYFQLLAEGHPVALDALFAPPDSFVAPPSAEWLEIIANRHRLIIKKSSRFLSYCRLQADQYGSKGTRVIEAMAALTMLANAFMEHGIGAKLGVIGDKVTALVASAQHMSIVNIPQVGGQIIPHWRVGGRKISFTASIKLAHEIVSGIVAEYGHRALKAANHGGVDWKALSHAVRIGHEAIELLRTGHITFPLLNAQHVLAIKLGTIPYQEVAEEIENLLVAVEEAAVVSTLPDTVDQAWIDDFVVKVYGAVIDIGTPIN